MRIPEGLKSITKCCPERVKQTLGGIWKDKKGIMLLD